MKKSCFLFSVLAVFSSCSFASATQDHPYVWLDFNASVNQMPADKSGWTHRDPGNPGCAGWGPDQSALCKGDSARIHWYYNAHNSDHIGWLRYGAFMATSDLVQSGKSLSLIATGGAIRDVASKNISTHGAPIKSLTALLRSEQSPVHGDYSNVLLPGSIPIYYKNTSNTTPIAEFSGHNRFTQWVWLPADPERRKRHSRKTSPYGRPDKTISWYPFLDDSKGGHYYHHVTNRPSGGWILTQWDAHPTHHNAGPYPTNHAFTEGGRDSAFDGEGYFSRITAFSTVYHSASNAVSPYRVTTDDWSLFYQPYENEETIANMSVGFDPTYSDFDISFEDKYRCEQCHAKYALFYSYSPISLATLHNTTRVTAVENFFTDDDNPSGDIIKPNPYYNQIWARFRLPKEAILSLQANKPLYFALQDISERGAIEDAADSTLVALPDGSYAKKNALLKTLRLAPTSLSASVQPVISAEAQHRVTQGETISVPLSSNIFKPGWQWVVEKNDQLSVSIQSQAASTLLSVKAHNEGEHLFSVRLRDTDGMTVSRQTFTIITRQADCRQISNCPHYTLVTFGSSAQTHDKPSAQWHTVIKDIYTNAVNEGGMGIVVGSNGGYQFAGIKGDLFMLGTHDVLTFSVKNATSSEWQIAPRVSTTSERRFIDSPSEWVTLPSRTIKPGETIRFEVPSSALASSTLDLININLPVNSQGIILKDIGLYSDKTLLCKGCGATLIDFYHNEGKHLMPYADWQTSLKDIYTGKVGERGSGIVIGSNGSYNFQGVKGNLPLPDSASNIILRWKNHGDKPITFSPKISFNDPDRMHFGEGGDWEAIGDISIPPGETALQYVPLPEGDITMVNVSNNINQNGIISLTKISLD